MAFAKTDLEGMAELTHNSSLGSLQRYIDCAEFLIQKCHNLQHISGMQKLERKCYAELKYLNSLLRQRGGCDYSRLRSSNLSHYVGVVHAAETLPGVTSVLQAFRCPGRSEALHVDVVAGEGHIWAKVIARKAQALHFVWTGQGNHGDRDLVQQVHDYLQSSKEHPVNFNDPQIVFLFYNGVTFPMADHLKTLGVFVVGHTVDVTAALHEMLDDNVNEDDHNEDHSPKGVIEGAGTSTNENSIFNESDMKTWPRNYVDSISRVNLDVTTLVALVSNVSNGSCHFQFKEAVLSQQAEEERRKPVKPDLDNFLKGKELFSCETAVASFKSILETLGGVNEKQRAAAVLERIRITPDNPSYRTTALMDTGKIKARSKIIFGTGDSLRAVTMTANYGFVRAAEKQGVLYAVYVHSSRALTEQKEQAADTLVV